MSYPVRTKCLLWQVAHYSVETEQDLGYGLRCLKQSRFPLRAEPLGQKQPCFLLYSSVVTTLYLISIPSAVENGSTELPTPVVTLKKQAPLDWDWL